MQPIIADRTTQRRFWPLASRDGLYAFGTLNPASDALAKDPSSISDGRTRPRRSNPTDGHRVADAVRRIPPTVWIPLGSGLLALGLCCYQLSLPLVLFGIHGYSGSGYDDGVYFGAATRLAHGVIPYRDFDFLQPPGITLVMSPIAVLGRLIGTRDAMVVARCVTVLVAGCNAALAALVVRRRGKVAMVVAGVSLALFPMAIAADQSLLLEPYLVLFSFLGILALFRNGELASPRRIVLAGLAIGFAGSIKLWAVLPAGAALLCCIPAWKRAFRPLIIGLIVGFLVPCLPFLLLAPHSFLHDVFTSQIHRGTSGRGNLSIAQRLVMISGFSGLPGLDAKTGLAVALSVVFLVWVVSVYATTWRIRSRLDWFVLTACVVVMVGMFSSLEFYDHYAYFPAAFLALLFAICVEQTCAWLRSAVRRVEARTRRVIWPATKWISLVLMVVVGVIVIGQDTSYASSYFGNAADPAAAVDAQIPQGACVVTDNAIILLLANRFNSASSGCPDVVDPFGMFLTRNNGKPPPTTPPFPSAFPEVWQQWFGEADYVIQAIPYSDYIPWTTSLADYFDKHFVLASSQPGTYIYNHFDRLPRGPAEDFIIQGNDALDRGDTRLALSDFRAAVGIDPADNDAVFDVGVVDQRLGKTAAATSAYHRALHLDPRFVSALYNLAVLEAPRSPSKAIDLYRSILKIQSSAPDTDFNLGILLIKTGQPAQGERSLRLAIATDPSLAAQVPAGITVP